ncbi:C13 family peptidase [Roseateles depolymerans]|uniref:Peptidase C13 family protein n=1 Tax=Roseateles depolymerans TaxID=76731 RepID=A0A0U3MXS2_9BURK|nr:C13 family peptidase [Roseateles depolymerans]ALV09210.1 Peptidase C13 family protein [Roseateles depolymerans]REG13967.1 peptidase C13-like protein [Roseateles depolymerans]
MTENENTRAEATSAQTAPADSAAAPMPDVNAPGTRQEAVAPDPHMRPFSHAARDWLKVGVRVLTFRKPDWSGLQVHPIAVLALLALSYLMTMGSQRGMMTGPVHFYPKAWLAGWATYGIVLWTCWVVSRSASKRESAPPTPSVLFMAMLVSDLMALLPVSVLLVSLHRWVKPMPEWPDVLRGAVYLGTTAWWILIQIRMLIGVAGSWLVRGAVVVLLPLSFLISQQWQPAIFWWKQPATSNSSVSSTSSASSTSSVASTSSESSKSSKASESSESGESDESSYQGLTLDDEVVFGQPELLARTLKAVQPPRPGQVNLYSITYAPYASQDVFMKESRVVTETLEKRFGAQGHTVELVLNPATGTTLPWAVPLALRKSIQHMADVMDRDRDVLFLHLTSHGARSGELAVDAWPMESAPVTPVLLKQWLDEAGIRWRVISISACYSGSWIDALVSKETLVMTAADADHTSYGCGSRSPLTFFGQAMYVDALAKTWSFEEAHAQARKLIATREKEAGKTDGYSNPQLRMGTAIRPVLERLAAQQASLAKQ